jgi:hypothetical protein
MIAPLATIAINGADCDIWGSAPWFTSSGSNQRFMAGSGCSSRRDGRAILVALRPRREAQLIARLKAIGARPAALVVAQRESMLRHCDSLLSIQHGIVKRVEAFSAAE